MDVASINFPLLTLLAQMSISETADAPAAQQQSKKETDEGFQRQ
ncbi:hypothetical protein SLEP1_g3250 [Rubroshorea leprosula]|uniref:Uncharacterized protein n=1 Tax=Rubroshorea leprosula TaxID=152421 RepID=A0AAV5HK77_9ROSI|nr:hypothetical protein SLEP1_g3250 [Rubroshorea leprosula]